MTIVIHRRAPALPFVPTELHGELVAAVACCYAGPVEDGEAVVRPLREFGSPVLDLCRPKPYLEHQSMFDPSYPHGWWYYVRACDVAELTDDVIDVTAEHAQRIVLPVGGFPIWQLGGAVGAGRRRRHGLQRPRRRPHVQPHRHDEDRGRLRATSASGRARSGRRSSRYHAGVYVNFLMDEGQERVRQAYGRGEVRPPAGAQAPLRPGQPPPAQPEHPDPPEPCGSWSSAPPATWARTSCRAWCAPGTRSSR